MAPPIWPGRPQDDDVEVADLLLTGVIEPLADDDCEWGTKAKRFKAVRALVVETGDLVMRSADGVGHWRFVEGVDGIGVVNMHTGEIFELNLTPLGERKGRKIRRGIRGRALALFDRVVAQLDRQGL